MMMMMIIIIIIIIIVYSVCYGEKILPSPGVLPVCGHTAKRSIRRCYRITNTAPRTVKGVSNGK